MKIRYKNHTEHELELRGVVRGNVPGSLLAELERHDFEIVVYIRDRLPDAAIRGEPDDGKG